MSKSVMPNNIQKAMDWLICRSYPAYNENCGKCAKFIREAVEFAFNVALARVESAKDYGKSYEKIGFEKVFSFPDDDKTKYKPELGDIAIINYEPHGHICMFCSGRDPKTAKDFTGWISDFKQSDGGSKLPLAAMYGGKIRDKNPPFTIYRLCKPS